MRLLLSKITFLLGILFSLLVSCNDDSPIPSREVYVETSFSEYQNLMIPNRYVIYPDSFKIYPLNFKFGFGGVCIYRDMENQIRCFDMACPYENLPSVVLTVEMPNAICPECGSRFDLLYGIGNPTQGPTKSGLKMYTRIRDNGNSILVTN